MAAALSAVFVLLLKRDFSQLKNAAPLYKYFMISVSNVLATSCQYEALKWVTLPTQTLAKCAKMVPVMIWGSLIDKKKYGVSDAPTRTSRAMKWPGQPRLTPYYRCLGRGDPSGDHEDAPLF